jgi:hypothetical protein
METAITMWIEMKETAEIRKDITKDPNRNRDQQSQLREMKDQTATAKM